jgi:hypothetical protein
VKPVRQTRTGATAGNCFQAALATILELEVEEVPEQPAEPYSFEDYLEQLDTWLTHERGLRLWSVPLVGPHGVGINLEAFEIAPAVPWIAGARVLGKDYNHAIVCVGNRVVHDPAPRVPLPPPHIVEWAFLLLAAEA